MNLGEKEPKPRIRELPLDERIRLYNEVMTLRKKYGWGYIRIGKRLSIPIDVVRHWIHHGRNPIRQGHPHTFKPKPSSELSYIIGVVQGDGDLNLCSPLSERSGRRIRLRSKDKDFVEKFALSTTKLLEKKKPYKVTVNGGQYVSCAYSYYLFEFLKKPLEELKPFIEAHPIEFIKGMIDSEGSVQVNIWCWKNWENLTIKIVLANTNLELLLYLKELLKKYCNIESNIKLSHKKGSKFKCNDNTFTRKKNAYDLVIGKINDVKLFASLIGFSINRKQEKLLDAIRIIENYKSGEERTKAWLQLYKKENNKWKKIIN